MLKGKTDVFVYPEERTMSYAKQSVSALFTTMKFVTLTVNDCEPQNVNVVIVFVDKYG